MSQFIAGESIHNGVMFGVRTDGEGNYEYIVWFSSNVSGSNKRMFQRILDGYEVLFTSTSADLRERAARVVGRKKYWVFCVPQESDGEFFEMISRM